MMALTTGTSDFKKWLENAKPKDRFTYHTGENARHGALNDAVRAAFNRGEVTLARRRLRANEPEFEFFAIRLAVAAPPAEPLEIHGKR